MGEENVKREFAFVAISYTLFVNFAFPEMPHLVKFYVMTVMMNVVIVVRFFY